MIKVNEWIKGLKHLALNRTTYYDNSFPGNCGEINADGSISFDCIGLVKSVINEPDICYKKSPAGYYVRPGQVIPDTTERGILDLCSGVSKNFNSIEPGEYLYYQDGSHAGVYVGTFNDSSGTVNVIECTPAFGGGVVTSYVDASGRRYNHKGGYQSGSWGAHGKLSRYIDYSKAPVYQWVQKWHLYKDGIMCAGWQKVNNKWYYMDKNGIMQTGWIYVNKKWYLLSSSGAMLEGWQKVPYKGKNEWFYLKPGSGDMVTGKYKINGKVYYFDSNGVWQP